MSRLSGEQKHTAAVTCSRIVTGTADLVIAPPKSVAVARKPSRCGESSRTMCHPPISFRSRISSEPRFQFPERQGQTRVLETALRKDSSFFVFTSPLNPSSGAFIAPTYDDRAMPIIRLLPAERSLDRQAIEINGVRLNMTPRRFSGASADRRSGRCLRHDEGARMPRYPPPKTWMRCPG